MTIELPAHLRRFSPQQLSRMVDRHHSGHPEWQLDPETLAAIVEHIERFEVYQSDLNDAKRKGEL